MRDEFSSTAVEPAESCEPVRDYELNRHIHPTEMVKAYAGHMIDKQGRDYIDLYGGSGSNILGHGYRCVVKAIQRQARQFTNPAMPFPGADELWLFLHENIPGVESMRFGKNGSDATTAAVRLARAITRRERVVHHGYHGFHDWWMASTTCEGIPMALRQLILTLPELTPAAVDFVFRSHPGEIACLILDPLVPPWASAETVREIVGIVHRHGALVIFDEVLSGFRVALGGAQEVWDVVPDLCCFGKAIANGMPLSVVAGAERWMRHISTINYGMTFEGEAVSIAAALATLHEVRKRKVWLALAAKGRALREAYARAAREYGLNTALVGVDVRPMLSFESHGALTARELRWICIQELARAGILTQGWFNLCYGHTDRDVRAIAAALAKALGMVRIAIDQGSTHGILDERIRQAL
ncbi:aminotransferase class III-fold pyridoxal phosphate-dependent enzyme [bacterium]|nr:aminotransferase class III-fold pyridoxal phosphate-dependent enzyme [bacterium]